VPVAHVLVVIPLLALVVGARARSLAGFAAAALLALLDLGWLLSVVGASTLSATLPSVFIIAQGRVGMVVGHLAALLLVLTAAGAFSARVGSQADLAQRAAGRKDYLAAGELWLQAGERRRAMRSFLRARAWGRAGEIARAAGKNAKAVVLLQRQGGDAIVAAAQLSARIGNVEKARQLMLQYGQYLVETRRSEQAIDAFLRAGDPRRAAKAVEMALDQQRLASTQAEIAIRAAREAKQPELAAVVALGFKRFHEAAELYLAADKPLEAARAFEQDGDPMRAAEALRLAGKPGDAARLRAEHLFATGQLERALEEYENAGMPAEAAAALERLGRRAEAVERYRRIGMVREAADLARKYLHPRDAAALYAEAGDWAEAGIAWERAGDLLEAARCFEHAGDVASAEEVLGTAGLFGEHARLLARSGRVEDGFNVLFRRGDRAGAWDLLSNYGGTFPRLAEPLVRLAAWLQAQGDVAGAIRAVQRAIAGMPVSQGLLPAFYSWASLLEDHGNVRAAESAWQKIVDFEYAYRDSASRLQAAAARRSAAERGQTTGQPQAPVPDGEGAFGADATSRYVLEQELGRGGMGVVYRARDTRLGRVVAIKVLNPRQHSPGAIRRFEREARAAAALSHPGIVHIYDFDQGFSSYFIAMEFVAGINLARLIRDEMPFVRQNLVPLMRQIVEAVAYAHEHNVVHRDLKPANMLVADRRQVKILDFGIAHRFDELDLSSPSATGTPHYMAPEQIRGGEPDTRSDIYALGATFFQMATGTLPFPSGNVLRAQLEQLPPDPRALAPDLDPRIAELILRCMAKDPDRRPQSSNELFDALDGLSQEVRT
jgi:eukaryotic-like serine/threonine-protein kinase